MSEVVIVGAGQAGARAALALRDAGFAGAITLLGDEACAPYERPALSKAYLSGESPFEKLVCLAPELAAQKCITLRSGHKAASIERAAKKLRLENGALLAYDHLILATGGAARVLPGATVDRVRTHLIRTREDADALGRALKTAKSLLVIGGGWLGLEVAATARKLGLAVDVVEAGERLCARAAPPELSDYLADLHSAEGVNLHLGQGVTSFAQDAAGVSALLANGTRLKADLVLFAIGLVPNADLAREAGLPVSDGIEVDADFRTPDPAIFAIGDCAKAPHPFYGATVRLESWQNANLSAARAAAAITGTAPPAAEAPWFWSDQFGHNIQLLGRMPPQALRIKRAANVTLFCEGVHLVGLMAIDSAREVAQARALVLNSTPLDTTLAQDGTKPLRAAVIA